MVSARSNPVRPFAFRRAVPAIASVVVGLALGIPAVGQDLARPKQPMTMGVFRPAPAPEEIETSRALEREVGPRPQAREAEGMNQFEQAVFCGVCDSDASQSLESALPTSWTEYGDAFFNRPDAQAGRWLQDQGCFSIVACAGFSNPANRFRMPLAFDYTANLPAFKVCGFISNFNAPNDARISGGVNLSEVPPDPSGNTFTPHPNCANALPVNTNNQRDQDVILFRVPAGGLSGFRLFVTVGQEYIASLGVNKHFPQPGDINSCYINPIHPVTPDSEFGYIGTFNGIPAITNSGSPTGDGPEGAINSTWACPRDGATLLPEGTYVVTVRLKQFSSLVPPSVPTPPSTRYQIQIVGGLPGADMGACCTVGNNGCIDGQSQPQCTVLGGVWRGSASTCASVNAGGVPCNLGACSSTAEGPDRDCSATPDLNGGCFAQGAPAYDTISPGQTVCGFSGGSVSSSVGLDEDWYYHLNASANQERVWFTLDAEHRSALQVIYAGPNGATPCAGTGGFGVAFDEPVRGAEIEACIGAGEGVFCRVVPAESPLPCGSPSGPAYRLTLTTGNCNQVACCTLAGSCSNQSGPDCYALGGISLGEGTTCASASCCSGAAVCAVSNVAESALPRVGSIGTSDACIDASNYTAHSDLFNGGCENTALAFSMVSVGQRICGTLSAFRHVADSDWYSLTTAGIDSYIGVMLRGQTGMDLNLYRKPTGVVCAESFAEMSRFLLQSGTASACDPTALVVGDCLPAGTYYIRVAARIGSGYGVPCDGGAPGAKYLLEIVQGVCTGTPVSCSGTGENEPQCSGSNTNGGCNAAPTPSFDALACNGTACGTVDLANAERDTDWYTVAHAGGTLGIEFESAFHGDVVVLRPGTVGPAGCGNSTVIDGRGLVFPNTPTSFSVPALPPGTYWVVVAPSFEGTKRVCCVSGSNYRLRVACTPPCACFFDLVGNDCAVTSADLTAFLAQFGKLCVVLPPSPKCADINLDGQVNTVDLTAFLGQFGKNGNAPHVGACQ